jgi:hypothetical protein
MVRQQKTAKELEKLIGDRAAAAGIYCFVKVGPDPAYGWHATAMTDPRRAVDYQGRIEQIAADLQTQFDLKQ